MCLDEGETFGRDLVEVEAEVEFREDFILIVNQSGINKSK